MLNFVCFLSKIKIIIKKIKIKIMLNFVVRQVREITRVFELKDGELSYVVQMATNQVTRLEPHLKALLKKH